MPEKCARDDCGKILRPGEEVIQRTTGAYASGYITASLNPEETRNWHLDCFPEYPRKEQSPPYKCAQCGCQIIDGQQVVYVCRGLMPDQGYFRAEQRGYTLLYISHARAGDCPKQSEREGR